MSSPLALRLRGGSPVALVLIGVLSVQFGAAIAKGLFGEVNPTTIVWLRLFSSTVVLLAWIRPSLRGRDRRDWLVVVGFGASLAAMNACIYQAFARIPLGIAVTIEFAGPLALAVLGSRRPRDLAWVVLAAVGVVLLGLEPGTLSPAGVLFALAAGAAWASYILCSRATGARWPGFDGLAMASLIGVLGLTPLILATGERLDSPRIWLIGVLVGLLSSVVPYSCELVALRSIRPAVFGILLSLEPAAAALAGILVVGEQLALLQWLAIGCVVAASVGATRSEAL
ncbi:MAG: EamA family transporter [Nocardioides sp.]|uniref:EamA family transporter n=1 Tax=Nocardioides sp. TaxID=35761 RepID=UPI0039E5ADD6